MKPSNDQVAAARILLSEIVTMLAEHRDDAVLVGGWVPGLLFPEAIPPHVGSIDVDFAMRLQQDAYVRLVDVLRERGFHQGKNGYQFFKEMTLHGRKVITRLDLLTSELHHEEFFAEAQPDAAPEPIRGAEVAFADNQITPIGEHGILRVAGIVAFLVMKSLAMHNRNNEKDAYDIHFCLENHPGGSSGLAKLFLPWRGDPLVDEALQKMAARFRSEEDDGPRIVATVEQSNGEGRAIRKLQVYTRVREFLNLCTA